MVRIPIIFCDEQIERALLGDLQSSSAGASVLRDVVVGQEDVR